jgi:hypothetical protein
MPAEHQKVDQSRSRAEGDPRPDARTRKLTNFLGVMVGVSQTPDLSIVDDDFATGHHFDWDPWVRSMMPEFAVIMSANRLDGSRKPVKVIVADTGQVIPLDKNCHPSDASLLLSGDKMGRVNALIVALDTAVRDMDDGSRVASARTVLNKLRRICRNDQ